VQQPIEARNDGLYQ